MGALIQLARQVLAGIAAGAGFGGASEAIERFIPSAGGFGGFGGFGGAVKRRRRRRKALTASDLATALTLSTAISKKAAEVFILQRTRAS